MPSFVEVCAGAGGLSSGFIEVGWTPLILNDVDKSCCDTLRANHPGVRVECCPMNEIVIGGNRKIDLLMGGIPCQSFSHAGLRRGLEDDRGQLIYQFIHLVRTLKPTAFLIENVKGMTTHAKGDTLKKVMTALQQLAPYTIQYRVLNAFDFGVPQKRERLFIVGIQKPFTFAFPEPDGCEKKVLRDVLQNVPPSLCAKYNQEKINLFRKIPPGGCWVDLPRDDQVAYLGNSYNTSGGKRGILRRLSMEEPCLTLLCTPSQKQTERCHPSEDRPLSIRECARIQTFPDDYIFCGSMASQYKQIGNAVPVLLAKRLATSFLSSLGK